MTESNVIKKFGGMDVPLDWEIDHQNRYAKTTKEKALEYFNESKWQSKDISYAAIEVRKGKKIFFVTGGFASYFWDSAKDVVIQEIKSEEQLRNEFSGDVPEGKFFVEKPRENI